MCRFKERKLSVILVIFSLNLHVDHEGVSQGFQSTNNLKYADGKAMLWPYLLYSIVVKFISKTKQKQTNQGMKYSVDRSVSSCKNLNIFFRISFNFIVNM